VQVEPPVKVFRDAGRELNPRIVRVGRITWKCSDLI